MYRLVKLNENGVVTGEALRPLLDGFNVPELPPLPDKGTPPKQSDYDSPGAFMDAWSAYRFAYITPFQLILAERDAICKSFAVDLASEFHVAKGRRLELVDKPTIYTVFAKKLTGLEGAKVQDPIDFICNKQV